jgi:cobalt/nickel transport system permease protein
MTLAIRPRMNENSPLVGWDARWKLLSLLLFSLAVATLTQLGPLLVSLGFTLALAVHARVAWRTIAERLGLILLGIIPFAILLPLTVTNGWQLVVPITLRGVTIGLLALVLVDTTPMTRLFEAMHALGVPDRLVWVMQLAYRYLFVFFAEVRRIRIAARTRGFRIGTTALTYRTLGHMAGAIVVRSGDRAEQVAAAMRCRGFHGQFRRLVPFQTSQRDRARSAVMIAITLGVSMWNLALVRGWC